MTHEEEFYSRCLAEVIECREEARLAGDYKTFSVAEIDVQNYQTMLNNATARAVCAEAT